MLSKRDVILDEVYRVVKTEKTCGIIANAHLGCTSLIRTLDPGTEFQLINITKHNRAHIAKIKCLHDNAILDLKYSDFVTSSELINPAHHRALTKYTITEVVPRIFHVKYHNQLDLALSFLRPIEGEQVANINVIDFLRKQAISTKATTLSYGNGQNVFAFYHRVKGDRVNHTVKDWNFYDAEMKLLNSILKKRTNNFSYYVIGSCGLDERELMYWVAKGLWKVNADYRYSFDILTSRESFANAIKLIKDCLVKKSLTPDDGSELSAHLVTGLSPDMLKDATLAALDRSPFIRCFKTYAESILTKDGVI